MKKLLDLRKDLSYLELEGQGRGTIMEVTRPLLLGLFYLVKWPVNPNILAPSVPTKIFPDCFPGSLLEGRAEIWKIFSWHLGRNDDLINSF